MSANKQEDEMIASLDAKKVASKRGNALLGVLESRVGQLLGEMTPAEKALLARRFGSGEKS